MAIWDDDILLVCYLFRPIIGRDTNGTYVATNASLSLKALPSWELKPYLVVEAYASVCSCSTFCSHLMLNFPERWNPSATLAVAQA